jgi:hypothetical protein
MIVILLWTPRMILSFLQEEMNMLRKSTKVTRQIRWFVLVGDFIFLWRDCSSLVVRHNDLCMHAWNTYSHGTSPASVGSPSLSSYATTANRAEEKQAKIERAPQLAVPGVRPQVHLAEVGSPVHGHLDVQADFFTLRLRVLPVGPHRRPPHHLRTRERRTRSVRVACRSVACPAYRTFDSICRWSSRQTTAARASRARGDR